ncbi:hypothetical protein BZG36_04966 [Bifiguratus adelaidae]|uniref:Uncharacterized protein n=1 Tax=Bifiguratus adelaidae TaxID=1938954 RepID=A0A261XUP1_9FUNG|nr:hypothetical protein BZG36_04966 [Bifiguratus adelaidae]
MASTLFDDYEFPEELYNRDTGEFTTPIKTLLQFTPHILAELPKDAKDQEPIHPTENAPFFEANMPRAEASWSYADYLSAPLAQDAFRLATTFAQFYMEKQTRKQQEEWEDDFLRWERRMREEERRQEREEAKERERQRFEERKRRRKEQRQRETSYNAQGSSDEEEEGKDKAVVKRQTSTDLVRLASYSMTGLATLTLSLYSAYKTTNVWGEVTFHDQLELLINHVQTIIASIESWITERETLGDIVPDLVRRDVQRIKEIADLVQRLDPRSEKKMEATGWAVASVGGLGVLGGLVVGSATVLSGGTFLAVGGLMVGFASRGRFSGRQYQGAKAMLESQVRIALEKLEKDVAKRQEMVQEILQDRETIKSERTTQPDTIPTTSTSTSYSHVKSEPVFDAFRDNGVEMDEPIRRKTARERSVPVLA